MNIGFYLTQDDRFGYVYADYLVRSVRTHLPGVEITQFTDTKSPALWSIDHVQRLPSQPLCLARALHYSSVSGDWLFLDTDCVIESGVVRAVFDQLFDIAVTDRNWPNSLPMPDMPYCTGVVFSRSQRFWQEMYRMESEMSVEDQKWYAEQKSIAQLLPSFRHVILPGAIFQLPPDDAEIPSSVISHYKGPRKQFLMRRIWRELNFLKAAV